MEKTLSASDILSYMDGGARLYRGSGDSKVELHMPGMSLRVIVPPFVFYALVAEGKIKPEGASAAGYYNKEHCRHYATASVQMSASKVFKPTDLPESNSSGYPAPFRDGQALMLKSASISGRYIELPAMKTGTPIESTGDSRIAAEIDRASGVTG